MRPLITADMNPAIAILMNSVVIYSRNNAMLMLIAENNGGYNMANKLFAIIRAMPDNVLADFRGALSNDIQSRKARGREYTSMRRLLGVAALESEIRKRKADLIAKLDDLSGYDYDWQKRADLR